jgi:hypothetical protein
LIFVPAIVSVGYYFEKKRSLAIGIAVCGSGLGTFFISPLNRILENAYGLKGAFLIKCAFILNMCICGLLMRPVPIEPSELKKAAKRQRLLDKSTGLCNEDEDDIDVDDLDIKRKNISDLGLKGTLLNENRPSKISHDMGGSLPNDIYIIKPNRKINKRLDRGIFKGRLSI